LGKKKRLGNLLEIAEACRYLKELYGSWPKVAKRINICEDREHISAEMIREFGLLLKLPEEVKRMIKENKITSVDIGYWLSLLRNPEDQISLAREILNQGLKSKDVRAIVRYKNTNPDVSIEEAMRRVLKSKTRVVKHHIVIMELQDETLQALQEGAKKTNSTPEDLAIKMMKKQLKPEWIVSFRMHEKDIFIRLLEKGFQALKEEAKRLNVPLKDLADSLIQNQMRS
jgi:ParB-like chromosome segregation protein Spo0J